MDAVPEVLESLAIGQRWAGDERSMLSPRHMPAKVLQVPELPRTRSGKLTELAVRAVVHGESPGNEEALANLEALSHFRDRVELQQP